MSVKGELLVTTVNAKKPRSFTLEVSEQNGGYHPEEQGLYIACKHIFDSRFSKDLLLLLQDLEDAEQLLSI